MSSSSQCGKEVSRIKELQNSEISIISDAITFYWSKADEVTRRASLPSIREGRREVLVEMFAVTGGKS